MPYLIVSITPSVKMKGYFVILKIVFYNFCHAPIVDAILGIQIDIKEI